MGAGERRGPREGGGGDTGRKLLEEKREINVRLDGEGVHRRDKEEEEEQPEEVFWWRSREMEGGRRKEGGEINRKHKQK